MGLAASAMLPGVAHASFGNALRLPLEKVRFGEANDAQTIIVYLMGGQGEIIGNMSNFDELVKLDPAYSNFDRDFTRTEDDFWAEAGGEYLQEMVNNGDATIFRTCEQHDTLRAHLLNQIRNMRGNNVGYDSGMVTTLMHVYNEHAPQIREALMPNVTFVDSNYQLLSDAATAHALPSELKPVSFGYYSANNPFERKDSLLQKYVSEDIRDKLANRINQNTVGINGQITDMFLKRSKLEKFMNDILESPLGEEADYRTDVKGAYRYDPYHFGEMFEMAMRILIRNPQTKVISMQAGAWDDHSNAIAAHKERGKYLFSAIKSAIDHAKIAGRDNINIIVFGDFGRNMKINRALGWDHGNNQNFMWFGGNKFVNHQGVVGKTKLYTTAGRIFTTPADDSYAFEPYSIAATFYKVNGVLNPEVLTGGYKAIDPSADTGEKFLKI